MFRLVLIRGAFPGLLPSRLLTACPEHGYSVSFVRGGTPLQNPDLLVLDSPQIETSLDYLQRLRRSRCFCDVLLIAPQSVLPPPDALSVLRLAAFLPVPLDEAQFFMTLDRLCDERAALLAQASPESRPEYPSLPQPFGSYALHGIAAGYLAPLTSLDELNSACRSDFPSDRFACFALQLDNRQSNSALRTAAQDLACRQLLVEHLNLHGARFICFPLRSFIACLLCRDGLDIPALVGTIHKALCLRFPDFRVTFSLCGHCDGVALLSQMFEAVDYGLRSRVISGAGGIIDVHKLRDVCPEFHAFFSHVRYTQICAAAAAANPTLAKQALDEMFDELRAFPEISADFVFRTASWFYEIFCVYCGPVVRQPGVPCSWRNAYSGIDEISLLAQLECCGSLDAIQELLKQLILLRLQGTRQSARASSPVMEAVARINETLSSPQSLQETAAAVGLSPSYFSAQFKQQTGCSFCEYVRLRRITAAIDLLAHTNRTIGQITCEVGFSDYRYFTKVFSRVVGITPSQFRIHSPENEAQFLQNNFPVPVDNSRSEE